MANASLNASFAVALFLLGCAAPNYVHDLRSLRLTPPTSTAPVASVPLGATDSSSAHLVQVRDAEPLHIHAHHDLVVVVKRGRGVLRLRDREVRVRAGDVLIIPRGVPHAFRNQSRAPALAIAIFSPPYDGKDMIPVPEGEVEGKTDSGVARQGGGGGEPL
ncbi:MAG: cupin domain-containing protein [Verrucomicrobiae bacterium]|nr:cupin domain-containing protein [Verrucomicrobiae bacterium]